MMKTTPMVGTAIAAVIFISCQLNIHFPALIFQKSNDLWLF